MTDDPVLEPVPQLLPRRGVRGDPLDVRGELGGLRHSHTVVTDEGIDILTDYPRDLESLTIQA